MGKNIITNIANDEQIFIDGATGQELTKEEFIRKYKKGFNLGQNRTDISSSEKGKGTKEN